MAHYLRRKTFPGFRLSTPTAIGMLFWIAEQKGFFADHDIKINLTTAPFSRRAMELLVEGKVDCAFLTEVPFAYLGYLKPRLPVKCIASIEKGISDAVIIRHAKGHNAQPQDLRGKRVGFLARATSHGFLMHFLERHGIDKSEIILKNMTPQITGDALMRGDVDAICVWEPHAHNFMHAMNELGQSYTYFGNDGSYASEVLIGTTKPFLIKNRDFLGRLLKALRAAEEFNERNRAEVIPLLTQKLKLRGAQPEKTLQKMIPALGPVSDNHLGNIRRFSQWIKENDTEFQTASSIPDYDDLVDNSLFFDIFGKNPL